MEIHDITMQLYDWLFSLYGNNVVLWSELCQSSSLSVYTNYIICNFIKTWVVNSRNDQIEEWQTVSYIGILKTNDHLCTMNLEWPYLSGVPAPSGFPLVYNQGFKLSNSIFLSFFFVSITLWRYTLYFDVTLAHVVYYAFILVNE